MLISFALSQLAKEVYSARNIIVICVCRETIENTWKTCDVRMAGSITDGRAQSG